jgi:uncharacterized membrane protein
MKIHRLFCIVLGFCFVAVAVAMIAAMHSPANATLTNAALVAVALFISTYTLIGARLIVSPC